MITRIITILRKDLLLEWRQKYSVYGLVLYLVSSVMAINLLQEKPEGETWNSLFWLILLFVSVNAVAKSFLQESKSRFIYYYTIHKPVDIILAKLLYNVILMTIMSLLSFVLFSLILGHPVLNPMKFLLMVVSGGISMAMLFTMLSAIAGMAGGNSALIAILGFPLVVPQLILLSDLTQPLFELRALTGWWKYFGILLAMDAMLLVLSIVLFPFLWKE